VWLSPHWYLLLLLQFVKVEAFSIIILKVAGLVQFSITIVLFVNNFSPRSCYLLETRWLSAELGASNVHLQEKLLG
jgi:hypothetical protein